MSKSRARLACLPLLACVVLGACSPRHHHHVITAKVIDDIRSGEVRWNEDLKSGQAEKILHHYAADAVVMSAGRPPVVGAAALSALISQNLTDPKYRLAWTSEAVEATRSGEFAIARGTYALTRSGADGADPATSSGTWVDVYRPTADGRWLVAWQITAPSQPGTPAPP